MKRILIFVIFSVVLFVGEASATRLAVGVNKANIRSGPGKNHEILWSVERYLFAVTWQMGGQCAINIPTPGIHESIPPRRLHAEP